LTPFWPTLIVLILDQLTKMWARTSLTLGESRRIIGDEFFRLTYVENSGVAFGLNAGSPFFLIVFTTIASLVLGYILLTSQRENSLAHPGMVRVALALILGGAIGNLIDRVLFARVTDFLDFDFPDFIMTRWPIFNLADSAVTIGVMLWCLYLVFTSKRSQVPVPDKLEDGEVS
jgi:signal peptidase II